MYYIHCATYQVRLGTLSPLILQVVGVLASTVEASASNEDAP